jgi:hypothetical protein
MENLNTNNKYYNSNKNNVVNFSDNDEIFSYEKEKPVYYTDYKREIKSIRGSGKTQTLKNIITNSTTSTIKDTFPPNKNVSPPLRQTFLAKQPLEVNAAREPRVPYKKSLKIRDYYYPTQRNDEKLPNPVKEKKKSKSSKIKELVKDLTESDESNKSNKSNESNESNESDSDKSDDSEQSKNQVGGYFKNNKFVPKYKRWVNNHFIYSMEPRYRDVVTPVRAYTWMYPFTPNTDDFYQDNINNTPPPTPLLFPDFYKQNDIGTYQQRVQRVNTKENFESDNKNKSKLKKHPLDKVKCIQNYNIIYFIIIVIIMIIYFHKNDNN